jgi:hypothetical protein
MTENGRRNTMSVKTAILFITTLISFFTVKSFGDTQGTSKLIRVTCKTALWDSLNPKLMIEKPLIVELKGIGQTTGGVDLELTPSNAIKPISVWVTARISREDNKTDITALELVFGIRNSELSVQLPVTFLKPRDATKPNPDDYSFLGKSTEISLKNLMGSIECNATSLDD